MIETAKLHLLDTGVPRWLQVGLLVVLACGVYANSFPGAFIMDDVPIVQSNPLVNAPNLKAIFTTDYWGIEQNSGLYRPLTTLSLAVNHWILGPDPWGYHLINVLLHATTAILVFWVCLSMGNGAGLSWATAALFALHPIHAEVVNTAVGRSELLVAIFLLAALRWALDERIRSLVLAGICYAAALLSKEHAVAFLAMLPLVVLFRVRQGCGRWRKPFFLGLALVLITLLWLALRHWGVDRGAIPPLSLDLFFTPLATLEPLERVAIALRLQGFYLLKLLAPWTLYGIYTAAELPGPLQGVALGWTVLTLLGILALACCAAWAWRSKHPAGLALLLYGVTFLPASNLLFATGATFAERLAYLPSVWFCLALVSVGGTLAVGRWRALATVCLILYLAALSVRTVVRNQDFQSPLRLWGKDVDNSPSNVLALKFLGDAQFHHGETAEALRSYQRMESLAPAFADGLISHAQILLEGGYLDEAIDRAQRVTSLEQGAFYPLAHLTLAQAYQQRGQADLALHQLRLLGKSCQSYDRYWSTLGKALEEKGDFEGALKSYRNERAVYMGASSDVLIRTGDLLIRMNRPAEAEQLFREELGRHEVATTWNRLGVSLALQNKPSQAAEAFRQAVRMRPDSEEYRSNLERATMAAAGLRIGKD